LSKVELEARPASGEHVPRERHSGRHARNSELSRDTGAQRLDQEAAENRDAAGDKVLEIREHMVGGVC
jgi:hypothetical protein